MRRRAERHPAVGLHHVRCGLGQELVGCDADGTADPVEFLGDALFDALRDGNGVVALALAPEAVLQVYEDLHGHAPPASTLLAIRASAFELGAAPSVQALKDLDQAVAWVCRWLTGELVTEEVPA